MLTSQARVSYQTAYSELLDNGTSSNIDEETDSESFDTSSVVIFFVYFSYPTSST